MAEDAYSIARYVRHYQAKNATAPMRTDLGCDADFVDMLVKNGVIELFPLYEGGPALYVRLTDKGFRMATERPRRIPRTRPR